MTGHPKDPPWYRQWREALEQVIVAQMARDATQPDTPEREVADREYERAFQVFRAVASQIK